MPELEILHKRGNRANLPKLKESEIAFTLDSEEVFIGTKSGNKRLADEKDLKKIEDSWVNAMYRTVIFVCPGELLLGPQDAIIVSPFNGVITNVEAFLGTKGISDVWVDIETSKDFAEWNSVLKKSIRIPAGTHMDDRQHVISTDMVEKGAAIRLVCETPNTESQNLTVNVTMSI